LTTFTPGLSDTAVIKRVGIERFDFGESGRVIGLSGVELVAAEHLDAALLGLRPENVSAIPTP